MVTDSIYIGIGILFMTMIPVCSYYFGGKRKIPVSRMWLFLWTLISVFLELLIYGNSELILGFILGSSLCYLLVVMGVTYLMSPVTRIELPPESNYYFSFVSVVVLILSTDYLFQANVRLNRINRIDGILLLLLLFVFLIAGFRKFPLEEYVSFVKETEHKGKIFGIHVLLTLSISLGSYFLVAGLIGASMRKTFGFSVTSFFILPWISNGINMFAGRERRAAEAMEFSATTETLFFYLFAFALGGIWSQVPVFYDYIYAFIFFALIQILLNFREKVNRSLAGSLMLTAYIAFAVCRFLW